jgi:2-polyprenyl-6-methoxyphenol hydroxylase-like FAD-dependent oxidoreductase
MTAARLAAAGLAGSGCLMTTVLVSGAGVAGPVVAYWLQRCGLRPTVVERRSQLEFGDGGHAVDLFGPAVVVMERMGLLDAVLAARTRTVKLSLIRPGRRPVEVDVSALVTGVSSRHVEILRGDLVKLLYGATRDDVEYLFGDAVAELTDTEGGVEVAFAHGPPRRFDLVVGADGLHSGIRHLVFGPVPELFLGGYLGVYTVPYEIRPGGRMLGYSAVDHTVGVYEVGGDGRARALFMFRSAELEYDHRDSDRQRQLLRTSFAGLGWDVPRLLEALDTADDFYFDAISQIRMDSWSRGRVTLVGDAGYCPGPAVGGGTSLAVVGAHVLAAELAAAGGDHGLGFPAYERAMAETVRQSRQIGPAVLRTLVPRSRAQVRAIPHVLRLLSRLPSPLQRALTSYGGGPAKMLDAVVLKDVVRVPPGP